MKIVVNKNFKKRYKKLRPAEKQKFKARRNLFLADPFSPPLNNHALSGKYLGCRSINIGGDLRAIYQLVGNDTAYFITIDAHSNLYK